MTKLAQNVFCATGEGGGVDPSCGKGESFDSEVHSSGSLKDDLETYELEKSSAFIKQILDHYDCKPAGEFMGSPLKDLYVSPDGDLIEWEAGKNYVSFTDAADRAQWVYDYDTSDFEMDYEEQFNKDFWEGGGGPAYHATPSENVESILKDGINAASETRGMSNSSVGDAVFATAEYEEALAGHYGDAILEIDTEAMKRDGYTPRVSLEPDEVTATVKESLAATIGIDDFRYDREGGMSPNTLVFDSSIPAKYVKRANE